MSFPVPAPLADRSQLDAIDRAIQARSEALQTVSDRLDRQRDALEQAWTSPAVGAYVRGLSDARGQLERASQRLESLAPAVRSAQVQLDAGEATYRTLVREWGAIPPNLDPSDAQELRQRLRRRYDDLVAQLGDVVRSVSSAAQETGGSLRWVDVLGGGLRGSWLGAVLTGAPTGGFVMRHVLDRAALLERAGLPAAWAPFLGRGHAFLDRMRMPGAAGGTSPFTDLVRRGRAWLRAPILQPLLAERIRLGRHNLQAIGPDTLRRVGSAGRWAARGGRVLGVVGTVATVVTVPGAYRDAREGHLAAGHSEREASIRAGEDVAFRTGGEVAGALAGAKGGAALGATLGSFIAPGVGTVVGGAVGGAVGALAGSQLGGAVGDRLKDGFRSVRRTASSVASTVSDVSSSVANTAGNVASGAKSVVSGIARRIF